MVEVDQGKGQQVTHLFIVSIYDFRLAVKCILIKNKT